MWTSLVGGDWEREGGEDSTIEGFSFGVSFVISYLIFLGEEKVRTTAATQTGGFIVFIIFLCSRLDIPQHRRMYTVSS